MICNVPVVVVDVLQKGLGRPAREAVAYAIPCPISVYVHEASGRIAAAVMEK